MNVKIDRNTMTLATIGALVGIVMLAVILFSTPATPNPNLILEETATTTTETAGTAGTSASSPKASGTTGAVPKTTPASSSGGPAGRPETTEPAETYPVIEAPALVVKNACSVLTPLKISQMTGIAVDQGVSKPSTNGGSVCEFQSSSGSTVSLLLGMKEDAPPQSAWVGAISVSGVGDTAFYQTPETESAHGVVVKGDYFAEVSLYKSSGTLTAGGVRTMLGYLAEQI